MNKQQLLDNLKSNIYCRIGRSDIHGVGVIAIRDIPKGIDPFVGSHEHTYIGLTDEEVATFPAEVQSMIIDFFVKEDGKRYVPSCGLNGIDVSFFMNHTENGNITWDDEKEVFFTNREVKKGEELTYSYAEVEEEIILT